MRRLVWVWPVVTCLACGSSASKPPGPGDAGDAGDAAAEAEAGGDAASPPLAARGVFVPVTFDSSWMSTAMQALALSDVDGIAVDLAWTDIAAMAPRTYDFGKLDPLLQLAQSASKGVELSVILAGGTPSSWFDPSTVIHLQYTPHSGATSRCYDTFAPPPWDTAFLAAWDDMTAQLAAHLASAGLSATVVALRLTGLNASTAETHLPTQSPTTLNNPPSCFTVDNVATWHGAGYTPTKIQTAWSAMVSSWATHFPSATFELVTWPGVSDRFPPIDDSGAIVTPSSTLDQAQYDATAAEAARQLGTRLVFGHWFLMTGMPADPVTVGYANEYGTGTLWQTNLWWRAYENVTNGTVPGAAACGGTFMAPTQCTDTTYLDELNQGVHPAGLSVPLPAGATRVIEVFLPDPTLYPNATHAVHQALAQ